MSTQKPKEKPKAGIEIGTTGSNIFAGIISEEYLSELSGTRAMRVYDEMRKSDATVKSALSAVQLPIRRAKWFVSPGTEDEQGKQIAEFVSHCLFEGMSITWDDFIRQALLNTTYGVMVFEKVFEIKNVTGQDYICWKKFAPRMPKSILAWQQSDGSDGITQSTTSGGEVSIPMDKLLVFTNDKEGDNWWGISLLRPAYKHWFYKSTLEKIDAIAHERQGLGVPFVKLPSGATAQDKTTAQTILRNMRANHEGYLIEPDGVSVEFKDMKASSTKDAARAIDYHDRQITKSVLAQFLSLGSGASGSYGLSKDHSDLFLQSIEAIAHGIADVINKYAVQQLVDLNFANVIKYPQLEFAGISRTDVDSLSVAYQRLTQSAGLKPNEADDSYLRKVMGLPENIIEEKAEPTKDTKEEVEEVNEDLGLPEDSKKKVENSEIIKAINTKLQSFSDAKQKKSFLEKTIEKTNKLKSKSVTMASVNKVLATELIKLKRKQFRENNDFKSWRKLTFAEKKVNFSGLQEFMDNKEAALIDEATEILNTSKDAYISKLTIAVTKNDLETVKSLEMYYWGDYKAVLKNYLKLSFEYGKHSASIEMDVQTPSNPQDLLQTFDLLVDAIATQHHYEIENEAKLAISNQLSKFGEKEIKALAAASVAMSGSIKELVQNVATVLISSAINKGRMNVFNKYASKIHALQRSEILDESTCNFCLSLDGRIVEPTDPIAKEGTFHSNCRGIWVEIMKDEEELPDIGGVPSSLRDRIGDAVNEIVQPKKPIVKKDSLAAQAINKGKAGASEHGTCGGARAHIHRG